MKWIALAAFIGVLYTARTSRNLIFALCLVLFIVASLSGCSLVAPYTNDTTRTVERTWLVMHAVDTAQTVTIARSPTCLREADPVAANIYGSEHPSAGRVIAINAALGYAHYRIGGWIDYRTQQAAIDPDDTSYGGWYLFRAAWHGVALIGTGFAVVHNAQAHVGPFSAETCK